MRIQLRLFLIGCLLICFTACSSNNPSTARVSNSTETGANQSGVGQPAANTNAAPGVTSVAPNQPANAPKGIDACTLLTTAEVAKIQGGAITEAKSDQRSDGELLMSQCFYTAEEFVRSVSVSVLQAHPANPDKQPKQYFIEKFRDVGKKSSSEQNKVKGAKGKAGTQETSGAEEVKKEETNAEQISGLGDQAFWVKSGPSTSLYVLKNNQFLILSIGGGDTDESKLKKSRELAQQALKNLK